VELELKSNVLAEPALVGREKELEELQRCLGLAVEGKGNTIFVSGEAGSGKTRLAAEFLNRAKKKGLTVLPGWCVSDAAVPYLPFVEAFDAYFSLSPEEESVDSLQLGAPAAVARSGLVGIEGFGITAWLSGAGTSERFGQPGKTSPQIWKDQLYSAVGKTLHSIAAESPVILFIEDIHWADSASLALLHYISRIIGSKKILVLATFRSEELTADAEGRPHPLAETLRIMKREDLFREVKLSTLDQGSVSKIAENMIGGSLQPTLAERLTTESRGNPLFIVESLRMLHEHRSLLQEDNQWRLAVDGLGIPSKIRDIVLRRLSVLKYAQRRVLDAASVIGEKFDVELLSTVLGLDSLEVLETLNVIAHSTSLVSVEANCYRFDHAKSREAIYEEIAAPLKRGYHARAAEKLENTSATERLPLSDLAHHYSQAGNNAKAVQYSLAAGQDALARWSNEEAIKHFSYVLRAGADTPENAEAKSIALEGLGDAYCANGMFEKAAETFEELAASATGSLKLRAYRKGMEAVWYKEMNPARAMESVKKVEEFAASDRLEAARVRWIRGRAFLFLGDLAARERPAYLEASLEDHEEALRVFKEEYSLPDVANLLAGTGAVRASFPIRLDSSHTEFEKSFREKLLGTALTHELGDSRMELTYINLFVAGTFHAVGLFQEALSNYADALQIGERIGDFSNMAFTLCRISELLWVLSGNWAEGMPQLLKALEYARKTDATLTQSGIYANLAVRYVALGDLKRAEEYYGELLKMPKEVVSHAMTVLYSRIAESVMLAAKKQWKEANQCFEKILELNKSVAPQSIGYQISIRKTYAWILDGQGLAGEARVQQLEAQRLSEEVEKRFAHANIMANFMAKREVAVGEQFEMRLDMVNVARNPASIIKVEGINPADGLRVEGLTSGCSLQNSHIVLKDRVICPFQVRTIKFALHASETGTYKLNPQVVYLDDYGKTRTYVPNPIAITVKAAGPKFEVLPGRITTGFTELDALLLGGIPEKYTVILASPAIDNRALLIKRFLEAGAEAGETTFYVTVETGIAKALAEKYMSNLTLFLCNPKADSLIQNLPNIFKLKGVENLTEIDIAMTKAFHTLKPSTAGPKRICLEIISDVLLQHHAVVTRKWLNGLLTELRAQGFTVLAVVNPQMHSAEEVQTVVGLFDGEINIHEKETAKGPATFLRVRKMTDQKYLKDEIRLTEE
jgi:tetratricopeptide (TPR) repeat protein/KaiC/GvpD/RAD55 family RecA-like ATPase